MRLPRTQLLAAVLTAAAAGGAVFADTETAPQSEPVAAPQPQPAAEEAEAVVAEVKPALVFTELDKNGDGSLTSDELGEDQQKLFKRLVRRGDGNDDGQLTAEEFTKATADNDDEERDADDERPEGEGRRRRHREGDREQRRGGWDDERGPRGDREERRGPPPGEGREGRHRPPSPEELFERFDANDDGKLTREELPERAREHMERLFERAGKDELAMEDFPPRPEFGRGRPEGRGDRDRDREGRRGEGDGDRRGPRGDREDDRRHEDRRHADRGDAREDRGGGRFRDGEDMGGPPPRKPPFLRLLDADDNGVVTREEITKLAEKFDELDRNEDGELQIPELLGPPHRRPGGPEDREGFRGGPPRGRGGDRDRDRDDDEPRGERGRERDVI